MPTVEFVGSSRQDADNRIADTSRLVNCYREPAQSARTQFVVKSVLGEEDLVDLPNVFLQEMVSVDEVLYAVTGGELYRVTPAGASTLLGSVNDGDTTISSNTGNITVAAGGDYYVWDGSSLTTPDTGAFQSVGSVTFLGQYTIVTEAGGRRFQWSGIADPTSFDALHFATKEARDDDILRAVGFRGRLVLFGERSIEIWATSGSGANAFARIPGGVADTGLKSYRLLTEFDQGIFFVGDDGIVYVHDGQNLTAISSRAVETALELGEPVSCFYYEDEGHKFACIAFEDRPAWCFDFATGEWHERAFGADLDPWPVRACAKAGDWFSVTRTGEIRKMVRNNQDADGPLVRRMVSNTLHLDGQRFRVAELEVFARVGKSDLTDNSGDPRPAYCWTRFSRDNGQTWGPERWRSLGDVGEYRTRPVWRSCGQYRQCTVELTCSEPAEIPFFASARVRIA